MRAIVLGPFVIMGVSVLAGCGGESGQSAMPADNPQASVDAMKKMFESQPSMKDTLKGGKNSRSKARGRK